MDDNGDSRRVAMATKGFLGEDDNKDDRHDRGDREKHRLCYAKLRKRGRLILTALVSRFTNLCTHHRCCSTLRELLRLTVIKLLSTTVHDTVVPLPEVTPPSLPGRLSSCVRTLARPTKEAAPEFPTPKSSNSWKPSKSSEAPTPGFRVQGSKLSKSPPKARKRSPAPIRSDGDLKPGCSGRSLCLVRVQRGVYTAVRLS